MALEELHFSEIWPNIWRAAWNLGTNTAFALRPRKTTESLDRVGWSQELPDGNWILASSPALTTRALTLVPIWKQVNVNATLRPKISRTVCLRVKPSSGAQAQIRITLRDLWVCWCGVAPLTRVRVSRLQLLLVLARAVILRSETGGTHDHILLSQIRDSPNLEGQVPVFISLRNMVARLYPQALGSLFVNFYESQGYGGSIWNRLHAGILLSGNLTEALYMKNSVRTSQETLRAHDNDQPVNAV
jgi:hypothetical protein